MPSISSYFQQAQLALAAYAKLLPGLANAPALQRAGFSAILANQFGDRWVVIDQINDPSSGLSATVFEEISTGKRYLAIRGTDDLIDLATDLINIGLVGTTALQPQYQVLRSKVRAWIDNGTLPSSFAIAGHSLGGFLAVGLTAELSTNVEHAYLYNVPGLNGVMGIATAPILRALGVRVPVSSAKVSNIRADAGVSPIAGLGAQVGSPIRVVIENQFNSDVTNPPAARNHSQDPLTDALALYALFGAIDPAIGTDKIGDLLRVASAQNNRTLESSLDALRQIFALNEATQTEQRESLYSNLYSLQASALFQSIANTEAGANASAGRIVSLVGMEASLLASQARRDFGYLFALNTLSPFALTGAGNIFSSTQTELYTQWQVDQSLAAADRAAGLGNFSDTWLQDRARFLAWKNQKNLNDIADDVAIRRKDNGVESYLYTDRTLKDAQGQDYSIRVTGGNTLQQTDPIRISFASEQGDSLQGGSYADHLYGGRGSDTLTGAGGGDYLEGGAGDDTLGGDAGDDTLIGGNGVDTLTGGAGDDTLQGGKGNDILQGGADNDVYFIRAGDGRDTIIDHEGRNTIIYTDANGKRSVFGVPAFAVAGQSNTWTGYLGAGGESVTFTRNSPLTATLPDGTQIVFDDYQDGEFGIQLRDLAESEPETTGLTLIGDLEPEHGSPILDAQGQIVSWEYDEDEFGNPITDPSTPAPDREDWFFGSDDDDYIAGFGGKDRIYAGDGADHLQGGAGADYIYGEGGDDVIEGQDETSTDPDFDRIWGGAGDDRIFATVECDIDQALAHANDAGLDSRGPIIAGEAGDDFIVGSADWDRISGGAGADVLIGGGGLDWIAGDANLASVFWGGYALDPGATAADADAIYGGGGGDWIRGGPGDDYVDGGDGDDFIFGEGGADTLFGGAGDDNIWAIVDERNDIVFDESDDYIDGGDGKDWIVGSAGDNILLGGAGNDDIEGAGGDDFIDGGPGDDHIQGNNAHGGTGNDVIAGTAGADTLYGDDGDDTFSDGLLWNFLPYTAEYVAGDDWLYGGAGNDTYILGLGTGSVHIVDDEGVNRIELMSYETEATDPGATDRYAPIAQDSIHIEYNDGSYKLVYGDAGNSVDLGAAIGGATLDVSLTRIGPAIPYDGNVDPGPLGPGPSFETSTELLSWPEIPVVQDSAPEGGTLIASEGYANTLAGKAGNDVIIGASRDDLLTGGPGDDILDGGDGGDRYAFNPGDGADVISDSGAQGADTLVFGPGIGPDALSLVADGLLIRIGESGDAVYVDGFDPGDAASPGAIERFEFADGTVLTHAELIARGFDAYGTDGGDTEFGTSVVDRFHQSAGDDTLIGGAGDDVYFFDLGSGHDLVVDQDTTPGNVDTIVLGSDIAEGGVSVSRSTGLLTLAIAGSGDSLDLQWQPQNGLAIERIEFADGTVWDSDRLESQAPPASPADGGAPATGGDEPVSSGGDSPVAADGGTADAGAGVPAGDEVAQTDNSETPPADAVPPDAVVATPVIDDTIPIANVETPPADIPTADAGTGTPAVEEVAQTDKTPDAVVATPVIDDTIPIANVESPPADTATADAGTGTPANDEIAQTGNSETPPADVDPPDAVVATPAIDESAPIASSDAPPADIESADAGTGTPAVEEVVQTVNNETPPDDTASPDTVIATTPHDDTIPIAQVETPPADIQTAEAGTGTPAVEEVAQADNNEIPSDDAASPDTVIATVPTDATLPEAVVATPVIDGTIPIANSDVTPADIESADAGTGTPASDVVAQIENSEAPPTDAAPPEAVVAVPVIDDAIPIANSDAPSADIESADAGTGTPASDVVAQIENSEAPPTDAAPPAAEAAAVSDDGATLTAGGDAPSTEDVQSGEDHSIAVADGGAAPALEPRVLATPGERDRLLAALQSVDATGSNAALLQQRNSAKAGDAFGAQFALDQTAAASSPAAFFAALQPPRPNLQPWLDNWFGPGARARTVERETSSAAATGEDRQSLPAQDSISPTMQDTVPPDLSNDIPQSQPAEALTPEEIAQSYADIAAWLDLHPGFDQNIAWEGGSPPEKNLFAFMQPASAVDTATSIVGFGPSPGMTAIGGHGLQPLRGISEGYAAIGLM